MKKVVVIAGPSGSGKNTIIRAIHEQYPKTSTLVTVTTRSPRPGEQNGVDYTFLTADEFDNEDAQGHLAGKRYVPLFGGVHYGISIPDLKEKMESSSAVFAPVDIEGARWLKDEYGATTIFIMPESFEQIQTRLRSRSHEMPAKELEMRMHITEREFRQDSNEYDYRVVNADGSLAETVEQIVDILRKEGYTL